jgi:hypothetical protein
VPQSGSQKPEARKPAPVVPLTSDMKQGKEPLRTFGDLLQFYELQTKAEEPPPAETQPVETPTAERQPADAPSAAAIEPSADSSSQPPTDSDRQPPIEPPTE